MTKQRELVVHRRGSLIPDDSLDSSEVYLEGSPTLPPVARDAMANLHETLARIWSNGGVVFFLHRFSGNGGGESGFNDSDAVRIFDEFSMGNLLPREIAGCSVAFLQEGGVYPVSRDEFVESLCRALVQGGAYSTGIPEEEAGTIVRNYVKALRVNSEESSLLFFALDPRFSCWFYRVAWDMAYLIANIDEKIVFVLLATDTD